MPRPKPSPLQARIQVSLTLPRELVKAIDKLARREDRTRTKTVELLIRRGFDDRIAAKRQAAQEAAQEELAPPA